MTRIIAQSHIIDTFCRMRMVFCYTIPLRQRTRIDAYLILRKSAHLNICSHIYFIGESENSPILAVQ